MISYPRESKERGICIFFSHIFHSAIMFFWRSSASILARSFSCSILRASSLALNWFRSSGTVLLAPFKVSLIVFLTLHVVPVISFSGCFGSLGSPALSLVHHLHHVHHVLHHFHVVASGRHQGQDEEKCKRDHDAGLSLVWAKSMVPC